MTANAKIAKLDHRAAASVGKLGTAAGVLGGLVSAADVEWFYKHLAQMTVEIVKPLLSFETPEIVLSVDHNRKRQFGHYKPYRDGLGLRWRVSLNAVHLGRPRADLLRTVLHEALHACQDAHGKPGKGNYHNAQFREWCERAGIPTDAKGRDQGTNPDGPFAAYCRRHKIEGKLALLAPAPKPPGSKLKKWSCEEGCFNVRVAVDDFDATCNACGTAFRRVK